ncbi:MAG TPA: UDP-galactopyranose mutase [Solirubrobacter sp.]
MPDPDVVVVGAGFAGAVMAERIAAVRGLRVLVIDRRDHIAGNAFDARDAHGVLIHRYGPHIFHTNAPKVSDYLSRFTEWREYEHRVLADVGGRLVPMPINRTTLNALYGLELQTSLQVQAFFDARAEPRERLVNSEDAVVAKVGRELYETLFRGYTRKQWGLDPSELHAQVCARIPVRTDDDDRYFGDAFQCMPADGYTALFERLLDHPLIEVRTGVEFADLRERYDHLVWTGPIDEYYGRRFGALPYRSLRFETETRETVDGGLLQPVAVINHPAEEVPYTRVTEYRHLTGQAHGASTLHYEYPSAVGDPYYPIPRPENRALYQCYAALAAREKGVTFVGRLARYQYLNMDQVVAQALAAFTAVFGAERAGLARV